MPTVTAHGAAIPALGLGTWQSCGDEGLQAIECALAAGYRHIDTAARYGNEAVVGEALRHSRLPRDDIFVTTKVWHTDLADGPLQASAEASLKRLGLDTVDLLLVHWPNPAVPLADTVRALCDAKRRGLARHIGVSNFPTALLDEAVARSTEPLVAHQCEYHPHLDQSAVIAACQRHGMAFIAYSPLGSGRLLAEPAVLQIAARLGRSPAQVVMRWHVQQGVAAIPKSANPQRIAENAAIFDFTLDTQDMAALFALARADGRGAVPDWAPVWDR